jgi:hypothetical protein
MQFLFNFIKNFLRNLLPKKDKVPVEEIQYTRAADGSSSAEIED